MILTAYDCFKYRWNKLKDGEIFEGHLCVIREFWEPLIVVNPSREFMEAKQSQRQHLGGWIF